MTSTGAPTPIVPRPSRALATLALLGIGGWAVLTALLGAVQVVTGLRSAWVERHPQVVQPGEVPELPAEFWSPVMVLAWGGFLVWVLYLNVLVPAVIVGIVHIALVHQSWVRAIALVVCVAVPTAVVFGLLFAVGTEEVVATAFPETSMVPDLVAGLGLIALAAASYVACRVLIGTRALPARL